MLSTTDILEQTFDVVKHILFSKVQKPNDLSITLKNNFHLMQTKWKFIPDMYLGP